ncbi:peptidase inhibitor family I36 protein [Streptomyces sp. NPDC015144]|uniref:peptidase inhibitor family I36 protein n=1 Tax=Streptomyces sp. NPDC015144 TaxID=3364944 RepID=UPI0036FD29B8
MRKRIALAAVAMVLASATGTAAAAETPSESKTADAVVSIQPIKITGTTGTEAWDNCLHGQACVFQSTNGTPNLWVVPRLGTFNLANYDMNNKISSLWNRSGATMQLFDTYSVFGGCSNLLGQFGAYGPTINVPTGINDKASCLTLF